MTRRSLCLALAAFLLVQAPVSWAQATPLLSDPAGDAVASVQGQASPAPLPEGPAAASADLRALEVTEEFTSFTLVLKLGSMMNAPPRALYTIEYSWDDLDYRIVAAWRTPPGADASMMVDLLVAADGGEPKPLAELEFEADPSTGAWTIQLPKPFIVNSLGHAPVRGDVVPNVRVTSLVELAGSSATLVDAMPDTGTVGLPITQGGESTGNLVFEAADPVRVSNGGATTFVYKADLQNKGLQDDDVRLAVEGLPDGWSARIPGVVKVPAEGEATIYAIVSVPFAHEHGGFSGFDLLATSTRDGASTGRVRFGVLHTPVPMPAGHHSSIWLHAPPDEDATKDLTPSSPPFMNTHADHARDAPAATPTLTTPDGMVEWQIPLGPQLQMGLDFDLNRTGTLVGSILGRASGSASLEATLMLQSGDSELFPLATAPAADLALDTQAPTPFTFTLTPTAESDYVAYAPGQNMVLTLRYKSPTPCCAPNLVPTLEVESFKMDLPLNEFHDQVKLSPDEAPSTLKLANQGPLEKRARPGAVAAYVFQVTNTGAAAESVILEILGNDAKLGTLAPAAAMTLQSGEARILTLGVNVPGQSSPDERLEVVLVARSEKDAGNLAIAHTATIVDPSAVTDDRAVLDAAKEKKDTPVPLLAPLAASAAALAWRRMTPRAR